MHRAIPWGRGLRPFSPVHGDRRHTMAQREPPLVQARAHGPDSRDCRSLARRSAFRSSRCAPRCLHHRAAASAAGSSRRRCDRGRKRRDRRWCGRDGVDRQSRRPCTHIRLRRSRSATIVLPRGSSPSNVTYSRACRSWLVALAARRRTRRRQSRERQRTQTTHIAGHF